MTYLTARQRCASNRRNCGADPINLVLCVLVQGWTWELFMCRACTLDYLQQRGTLRVHGLTDREPPSKYHVPTLGRT